jgi:hypothetical protein
MVCLLIYAVRRDSMNVMRYFGAAKKEETVVKKDGTRGGRGEGGGTGDWGEYIQKW